VLKEVNGVGKKNGLKGPEVLGGMILDEEEWTPENGMTTAAQKVRLLFVHLGSSESSLNAHFPSFTSPFSSTELLSSRSIRRLSMLSSSPSSYPPLALVLS
jgi:hypothetical protein